MSSAALTSLAFFALFAASAAVIALSGYATVLRKRLMHHSQRLATEIERRQAAETQATRLSEDLESSVRQRTQSLEQRNEELTRVRLALETANQRLKRLVSADALTGISNRRHFDRALERELRRTRRERQPLSLIFMDLDEFKRFNDTYGHARGDDVLRQIAQSLDESFRRGGDFVARYGGEEFAVVLPGVDGRRASLYAERLRRRIWRLNIPYAASQVSDRVTISAGVATVGEAQIASPATVLLVADRALYRAKCLGKNRIVSASVASDVREDESKMAVGS